MSSEENDHRELLKRQKYEETKRINDLLNPYWNQGMQSAKSDLVAKAMFTTHLSGKQVKQYIEKKKRIVKYADLKAKGQLPVPKKKLRIKKTRGYDKFRSVRMQKPDLKNLSREDQGKKMRVATAEWMAMPEDEKAKWKSLAQNDNVNFKAADLRAKRMRKKAKKLCQELWDAGVVATLLLPPEKGVDESLSVMHPIEMKPFWDKKLMDPVLAEFGDEVKRWEAIYQLRNEDTNEESEQGMPLAEMNDAHELAIENVTEDIATAAVNEQGELIDITSDGSLQKESVIFDCTVDQQGAVNVTAVYDGTEESMPLQEDVPADIPIQVSPTLHVEEEASLGETIQSILGTHDTNVNSTGNEVVDLESKSASAAMESAQALAKKARKQAARRATQKENKKTKRKGRLVGRQVRQLWEMDDKKDQWFNGVIMEHDGDEYRIHYEGDEDATSVPVTEFQTFRRNKTLFVV